MCLGFRDCVFDGDLGHALTMMSLLSSTPMRLLYKLEQRFGHENLGKALLLITYDTAPVALM